MFALNAVTFSAIKGMAFSLVIVNIIVIVGVLIMLAVAVAKTGKAKEAPQNKCNAEVSSERQSEEMSDTHTKNQ